MQLTISKNELAQALRRVGPVAKSGAVNPVLANILLTAKDGTLELYATDMVLGVRSTCSATVAVPGSIITPGRQFIDRVAALPDGLVHVQESAGQLVVKAGERLFQLQSAPGDEYPTPPAVPDSGWIDLPHDELAMALGQVRHAISDEDSRTISNLAIWSKGGRVCLLAHDGSRLAMVEFLSAAELPTIFVHRKCVAELAKLCEGPVKLCVIGTDLHVQGPGAHMSIRCGDGMIPPIDRVRRDHSTGSLTVERSKLLSAVKAVSLAGNEHSMVMLAVSAGAVELTSESDTYARDKIVAETRGSCQVALNYKFLIDLLNAVPGDDVRLDFQDGDGFEPVLVAHRDDAGREFFSALMPMRK